MTKLTVGQLLTIVHNANIVTDHLIGHCTVNHGLTLARMAELEGFLSMIISASHMGIAAKKVILDLRDE